MLSRSKIVMYLVLQTILGTLIFVASFAIMLPFLIIFVVWSEVAYHRAKKQYGSNLSRATGLDILFGIQTPNSDCYINAVAHFKGKMDMNYVKDQFYSVIRMKDKNGNFPYRRLIQVFEKHMCYYLFKDAENFDLRNHIKIVRKEDVFYAGVISDTNETTPLKGCDIEAIKIVEENQEEKETNYKQNWEYTIERLLHERQDKHPPENQPQWEYIFLQEEEDSYTCLFRVHHSMTDGLLLLQFILKYLTNYNEDSGKLPFKIYKPSKTKKVLYGMWSLCLMPLSMLKLLFAFDSNPFHGSKLSGRKIYLASKPAPLKMLTDIHRKTKVSCTCILLSCLSKAFDINFQRKKSEASSLTIVLPFSMHEFRRPNSFRNNAGLKPITLPIKMNESRTKSKTTVKGSDAKNDSETEVNGTGSSIFRLKKVQIAYTNGLTVHSALGLQWTLALFTSILPVRITKLFLRLIGITTGFSNMAGPEEAVKMLGCEKEAIAFWPPDHEPMGMAVSAMGYNGQIRIGMSVDTAFMEESNEGYLFLQDFVEELYELHKETQTAKALEVQKEDEVHFVQHTP